MTLYGRDLQKSSLCVSPSGEEDIMASSCKMSELEMFENIEYKLAHLLYLLVPQVLAGRYDPCLVTAASPRYSAQ